MKRNQPGDTHGDPSAVESGIEVALAAHPHDAELQQVRVPQVL